MKIVIVEDEKPAARRLQRMIEALGHEVIAALGSVEESIAWFSSNPAPDLITLDIQLSDGLSFEIFDAVSINVPIIFTTAYDEYALKAFKLNSIDYLLKPIDDEDLEQAFKQHETQNKQEIAVDFNDIKRMLTNPVSRDYKQRFSAKVGTHIKLFTTDEIQCFYSQDKGTWINTIDKRNYLLDSKLEALQDQIDPRIFFRVSRTYIVNINCVKDIIDYSNSRLRLVIDGMEDHMIIVSRERVKDFKQWIG